MANLQVNIEIPEEEFKKVCIDNINDLPKEQMQELLMKAVETALINDNKNYGGSILVQHNGSVYNREPTQLMKDIIKGISAERYLEPLAKEVAEFIKDNYTKMVRDYIVMAFSKMLFSELNEYSIKSYVQERINDALCNR